MRFLILGGTIIISCFGSANAEILILKSQFKNKSAVLAADTTRFAGAVSSFTWDGGQFIDSTDHGRLLQSAASFDGLAGCLNPTEAGSYEDSKGNTSSSKVVSAGVSNSTLSTAVDAAFWFAPGPKRKCGARTDVTTAVNTDKNGGYIISKKVSFGYKNVQNVIRWLVTFKLPHQQNNAEFEVLTGYMPSKFSQVYEFAADTGKVTEQPSATATHGRPLIVSEEGSGHAMGIICPSATQTLYQFMRFDRQGVVKWNCLYKQAFAAAGDHGFQALVFFGSLEDVAEGMRTVTKK